MDDAVVTATSPQEDEFALLLLGTPSLYRGFLDPRRLPLLAPLLDGADGDDWLRPFTEFARGVAARRPGQLVLKSPNHLFRIQSIRGHLPAARHLVLLRDASALYRSNLRMWTVMADLYGHWPAPDGAVAAFVVAAMEKAAQHLDTLAAMAVAGAPVVACRLERLAADPAGTLAPLLPRLGLPHQDMALAAIRDRAAKLPGRPRTEPGPLPIAAAEAATRLDSASARLLAASRG
jgi:hypothetical protein